MSTEFVAYPDRPHLENSRQIIWDRTATTTTSRAAVTALADRLLAQEAAVAPRGRARRPNDLRRFLTVVEAMALDLFVLGRAEEPTRWMAYSRRSEDYSVATRYRRPDATYTAAVAVADLLAAADLVDHQAGSFMRSFSAGYRSRLRARPDLIRFLADHGLKLADIGATGHTETVILRDAPEVRGARKPLLDYDETPQTREMRRQLLQWAEVAAGAAITVGQPDGLLAGDLGDDLRDVEGNRQVVGADILRPRLYRVFNNGSFEQGGRFYGGWWQGLPKARRATIRIDGEPTVELDFKALHPRLCHDLEGVPLARAADPYVLQGEPQVDRDVLKRAFAQLVASGPDVVIQQPADAVLPPGVTYLSVLERLEAQLSAISPWLRQARALRLQRMDSDIVEGVLGYLSEHRGIVVLPVHDSFIVQRRHEVDLGRTMAFAYKARVEHHGGRPSIPVISGWSSADVEQEAMAPVLTATTITSD